MKTGLYFGTFNPIHVGHLIIANHMVEYSDMEEVWIVVSPHNPLKNKSTLLEDYHRFEMVYIAVQAYPKLKACDIEFKLPQPSYTINTLTHIAEKYPERQFSLIAGEDALRSFHKWKNYKIILENHHMYVYPRISENSIPSYLENHPHIHRIKAPVMELSATAVRNGIATKKNVRPLLPHEVWEYLDRMNFYKTKPN